MFHLLFSISVASLIAMVTLSASVSAEPAAEEKPAGLVMMIDFKEPGVPSKTIRVTLENRSDKPMSVVRPFDIQHPYGGSWWCSGSYYFFIQAKNRGTLQYQCPTPPPPAIPMPYGPADLVVIPPAQSIGALIELPMDAPELVIRKKSEKGKATDDEDLAPTPPDPIHPGPFWQSPRIETKELGDPPPQGWKLTVIYRPSSADDRAPRPIKAPLPEGAKQAAIPPIPKDQVIVSNSLIIP